MKKLLAIFLLSLVVAGCVKEPVPVVDEQDVLVVGGDSVGEWSNGDGSEEDI